MSIDFSNIKSIIRLKKQQKDVKFLKEVILTGGDIARDILLKAFRWADWKYGRAKFASSKYGEVVRLGLEEYMKTGKLSALEKFSENYIMKTLKTAKYVTFGPEPIFAYIVCKGNRNKNNKNNYGWQT